MAEVRKWASGAGVALPADDNDACAVPEVVTKVLQDMNNEAGKGVGKNEKLVQILLISGPSSSDAARALCRATPSDTPLLSSSVPLQLYLQSFALALAPAITRPIFCRPRTQLGRRRRHEPVDPRQRLPDGLEQAEPQTHSARFRPHEGD